MKLKGVPNTHTSASLRLMFSRMKLMGVQRERNLAKSSRTTKLLRIPATKMKPRKTATTVWPVRLSPPGLWVSHWVEVSVLEPELELERELSVVLKLLPRRWTTISVRGEEEEGRGRERKGEERVCASDL